MKQLVLLFTAMLFFAGCASKNMVQLEDLHLENKNYPNPEEMSNLSFALADPEIRVKTEMSRTLTEDLKERLKYDVQRVACHLSTEVKKVLLSKGFTITQQFRSLNHMTFTQKRNTSALFYPVIIITVDEDTTTEYEDRITNPIESYGNIKVRANAYIVLLEPLSGEKVWMRNIPVPEYEEKLNYKYDQDYVISSDFMVSENSAEIAQLIDRILVEIDQKVIEATNKYVERNEFEFLNEDIAKLKGIKRY